MRRAVFIITLILAGSLITTSVRAEVAPVVAQTVEYQLPYPGLLPDSPFYLFKVARDRITIFLLRSPKDKAFYYLLLADKRAAAAAALAVKKDGKLAVVTLERSGDYFRRAVEQVSRIKNETDQEELLSKLVVSGAKHEEVFADIAQKVSGADGARLEKVRRDGKNINNRVMEMFLRNLKLLKGSIFPA